ncbi:tRNA (guanosine(46)-N7)-methyltransferase TrmB [Aureibacter tunicatorum]|uniref:tRNA (guanine-N(7)-)-methyltransferase n=1 Tax=Aureibacter tunicatorum TaxID=866807 RepID=A0AAE4BSC1_9BACT|nr:tRNA (guanosine(46)-N7)-methyltransferase TrmB [Aureibacter tunicatorum]MDR6239606.1 tRNA (guanine-N7-)-methyltransferase [Aureibacter tunicatorum]BDD04083.1 tRNA (guanine-N(7)-)-methyltransferase [Aureibacter tunicatorum]
MRNKLGRFADNEQRYNIVQQGKEFFEAAKGKWNSEHFKNENDIVLELACGNGEYTVGLAEKMPEKNFIGVDIKGSRMWVGSSQAIDAGMDNVAFLRTQILMLEKFFGESEISEIWITFPDPRPRDRDEKRRLTHTRFLEMYKKILKPGGWIKFKTDNTGLFDYTLELLQQRDDIKSHVFTKDLYEDEELMKDHYGIKTRFEAKFYALGEKIKYMKFQFKDDD